MAIDFTTFVVYRIKNDGGDSQLYQMAKNNPIRRLEIREFDPSWALSTALSPCIHHTHN
jgi:hypothetical protein